MSPEIKNPAIVICCDCGRPWERREISVVGKCYYCDECAEKLRREGDANIQARADRNNPGSGARFVPGVRPAGLGRDGRLR